MLNGNHLTLNSSPQGEGVGALAGMRLSMYGAWLVGRLNEYGNFKKMIIRTNQ